jgi:hypothetical protein
MMAWVTRMWPKRLTWNMLLMNASLDLELEIWIGKDGILNHLLGFLGALQG